MVESRRVFGNDGNEVEKPILTLKLSSPFLDVDKEEYYQASITLEHPEGGEIAASEAWMLEAVYHSKAQLDKLAKVLEAGLVKQAILRAQQIRVARHKQKPEDLINAAAEEAQKLKDEKKGA